MKIAHMYIGLLIEGDDSLSADVLMNYAINCLNIKNDNGILRHVEVREIKIPNIVDADTNDAVATAFHTGPIM